MPDISVYEEITVTEDVASMVSVVATGTATLSSLEVTGLAGAVSDLELPALTGTGSSLRGDITTAALTLPSLVVAATSSGPNIAYAALELPSLTMDGTSIHDVLANAAVSLPSLWASGLTTLSGGEVIGYALNLRALGLSKYEGYSFNSLCVIGGKSFGASSAGLYLLEGDDDEGVNVDAYVTFPLTDFGEDNEKRVRSVYFGGTADKQMKLHVWANEGDERTRTFIPSTTKGKTAVPVGRGDKGEYWKFKVSNLRGADFEINSLEAFLVVLRRGGYIGS